MAGAALDQADNDGLHLSRCAMIPNFVRLTKQKWQFACAPPLGPRPQLFFRRNVLWFPMGGLVRARGEPLSQLGRQGQTPLDAAALKGHPEVVQLLISAGPLGGGLEDLPSEGRRGRSRSHCRDLP